MSFPVPDDYAQRPVAVIGAGTLGRRIALMFASRGGEVRISDPSAQAGQAAVAYIAEHVEEQAAKLDGGAPGRAVHVTSLPEALAGVWLAVEAVPEHLELKKEVFGQLDALAPADAILGSNSSSYASRLFLDHVKHPERVLNTHFYMPPAQNALDVMSDGQTAREVVDFVLEVFPKYGIFPFEAKQESTGFIFNRIWAAIKRESLAVVAEGVSTPQDVDEMFKLNFGTSAGPFQMMDHVGLDVAYDIEQHYADENPHLPEGPRQLLKKYLDQGKLGVKSGSGFYEYS